jgi:hypothetical protein
MVPAFQWRRASAEQPASRSTAHAMVKHIAFQTRIPSRFALQHSRVASTIISLRIVVVDSKSTRTPAPIPDRDALLRIRRQYADHEIAPFSYQSRP